MQKMGGIVIYDRGVPDNIAYAQLLNLDYRIVLQNCIDTIPMYLFFQHGKKSY
jgi:hypothetical protein